jgi:hypothetical protein
MITFILFFISCSSTPAPSWQATAFNQMENYISTYMEGKTAVSQTHYRRFYESLLLTADPDIIVKAPLVKCAVESAVLIKTDCSELQDILPVIKKQENTDYYRFIVSDSKLDMMEGVHSRLVKAVSDCRVDLVNKAVSRVEEGLSTLVAASYALRHKCYDEETLNMALTVSSKNGWIKASSAFLKELESFYRKAGNNLKADEIRKRLDLISEKSFQ